MNSQPIARRACQQSIVYGLLAEAELVMRYRCNLSLVFVHFLRNTFTQYCESTGVRLISPYDVVSLHFCVGRHLLLSSHSLICATSQKEFNFFMARFRAVSSELFRDCYQTQRGKNSFDFVFSCVGVFFQEAAFICSRKKYSGVVDVGRGVETHLRVQFEIPSSIGMNPNPWFVF